MFPRRSQGCGGPHVRPGSRQKDAVNPFFRQGIIKKPVQREGGDGISGKRLRSEHLNARVGPSLGIFRPATTQGTGGVVQEGEVSLFPCGIGDQEQQGVHDGGIKPGHQGFKVKVPQDIAIDGEAGSITQEGQGVANATSRFQQFGFPGNDNLPAPMGMPGQMVLEHFRQVPGVHDDPVYG